MNIKVSHSLIAVGTLGLSWAQQMKDKAHLSPFAALSFSDSKKVPIYCLVGIESFPVVG